jgi:hypothetical protein
MLFCRWVTFVGRCFFYLQKHCDGEALLPPAPFSSLNVMQYGSKMCSSCQNNLVHHFNAKLQEPSGMFWKVQGIFLVPETTTRSCETQKYELAKNKGMAVTPKGRRLRETRRRRWEDNARTWVYSPRPAGRMRPSVCTCITRPATTFVNYVYTKKAQNYVGG